MKDDLFTDLFGSHGRRRRVDRDERLFVRGDPASRVFGIVEGVVRLERPTVDGDPAVLVVARAGDLLAESAPFVERYHCDAVAETAGLVLEVEVETLRHRWHTRPEAAVRWIESLSAEIRSLRGLLELRSHRSARTRLLRYLESRAGSAIGSGASDGTSWRVAAEQIGLRPETVYRLLSTLEREGLVVRDGRRVRLIPGVGPRPSGGS